MHQLQPSTKQLIKLSLLIVGWWLVNADYLIIVGWWLVMYRLSCCCVPVLLQQWFTSQKPTINHPHQPDTNFHQPNKQVVCWVSLFHGWLYNLYGCFVRGCSIFNRHGLPTNQPTDHSLISYCWLVHVSITFINQPFHQPTFPPRGLQVLRSCPRWFSPRYGPLPSRVRWFCSPCSSRRRRSQPWVDGGWCRCKKWWLIAGLAGY